MIRKKLFWMVLAVLVICMLSAFITGCGKRTSFKKEVAVTQEQQTAGAEDKEARERALREQVRREQAAKEKALREQTLREQTIRERPLREQPAGEQAARGQATGESAERAAMKVAEKEAPIPNELQIPDIHFDYDKYTINPEAQAILKEVAPAYLKYAKYRLTIEGHCDERGTVEYNLALGQKRADETAKYLIQLGIEKEQITTISYGQEKPLDPRHEETAWAKNRRAHFVVSQPMK